MNVKDSPFAADNYCCIHCKGEAQQVLIVNLLADDGDKTPSLFVGYWMCVVCYAEKYNDDKPFRVLKVRLEDFQASDPT